MTDDEIRDRIIRLQGQPTTAETRNAMATLLEEVIAERMPFLKVCHLVAYAGEAVPTHDTVKAQSYLLDAATLTVKLIP